MARKSPFPNSAWEKAQWEPADASAIQALFRGTADEHQQRRAVNFIVRQLCAIEALAYDPKNSRNTDFALGKQAVGHEIIRLMRLNVGQFTQEIKE